MKYNCKATLKQMKSILGEDKVKEYQKASQFVDKKDNPCQLDKLHYLLCIQDCILTLFDSLKFDVFDNEYDDSICKCYYNPQISLQYFQEIYREDVLSNN